VHATAVGTTAVGPLFENNRTIEQLLDHSQK